MTSHSHPGRTHGRMDDQDKNSTHYVGRRHKNTGAQVLQKQENRAVARKPRDAAAILFSLKFADNIHYKFRPIRVAKFRKPWLQTYW